jgi:hypothetical protein
MSDTWYWRGFDNGKAESHKEIAALRGLLAEWLKISHPDARADKLAEATEKALRGEGE